MKVRGGLRDLMRRGMVSRRVNEGRREGCQSGKREREERRGQVTGEAREKESQPRKTDGLCDVEGGKITRAR